MADPTTDSHTVHVVSWDYCSQLDLRCHSGPEAPCRYVTDQFGDPQPADDCNAIEWWGNCDPEDLIHGPLKGEPPWTVDVEWTDDGPHIKGIEPYVGEGNNDGVR